MSSEVKTISGTGIPLRGNDIDTDRIIPARFLRCVTFDGLGENVFTDDRASSNGQHPFDQPQYQNANLLVVNGNFGCGSSREHAPQAIARWGIQAILGESFAEIFFGNCVALGIPCVTASPDIVTQIQTTLEQNPDTPLHLDLENLELQVGETKYPVQMNEGAKQSFISGKWDSCAQLVNNTQDIQTTAAKLPYLAWS
ncbi:3-isopropylmalate dehydratase small subunit [Spirulina sp. CS-785/01]|uniref:3-isopropylmalate dehydratase small subunit n=1 Tax=Spirulina sp. CS-785/01 TaxID=3021716 RepID=UPI00232CFD18|nr:3-isopropylmalate dehydratase small subunit [Spirulina sp. CS-785/01]MDB9314736.1 3-isopropylmalate dehydratase small subunit [Spirulina sp. CS-785/01]